MPKAAIFFSTLLLSSFLANSYAFTGDDVYLQDKPQKIDFSSNILDIDQNFFVENNFKRYLIFGTNSQNSEHIKKNSLYGIQSNHGFFYVSILSEKSASSLATQGVHIIEDYKLDFHSANDVIQDVSRIGEITGSNNAKKNYDSSGNGLLLQL